MARGVCHDYIEKRNITFMKGLQFRLSFYYYFFRLSTTLCVQQRSQSCTWRFFYTITCMGNNYMHVSFGPSSERGSWGFLRAYTSCARVKMSGVYNIFDPRSRCDSEGNWPETNSTGVRRNNTDDEVLTTV